jgi:hypothetical protein
LAILDGHLLMKRGLKILLLVLSNILFNFNMHGQQNFIYNYDFEFYSQCPDNLGQANRCIGFFSLIEDADYTNCNFDITMFYPSDSGAYSGTGFMTMATYGNNIGAAESIAQNIPVPLDSGVMYDFQVLTKRADSAQFIQDCGGIYLYGFQNTITGPNWNICVANLPGATLLGHTDTIKETTWTSKSLTFVSPFAVNAIAFSPACAVNCFQVLFLDSVSISLTPVGISNIREKSLNIFPVPADKQLKINLANNYHSGKIKIYDVNGSLIIYEEINANEVSIDTSNLISGIYFIQVFTKEFVINRKIIVQH